MATVVARENLTFEIERRIRNHLEKFSPKDPRFRTALTRIGVMLEGETKLNIKKKKIIDTGRLLNSIRFEFFKKKDEAGLKFGSFGVPYAAIHEFGADNFSDLQRRAMFATLNRRRQPRIDKNIIDQSGPTMRFKSRPYLRPAIKKTRKRMLSVLLDLFNG